MSGGHWNYADSQLRYAIDDIQHLIDNNDDDTPNEWGQPTGRHYPPEVLNRYREAITVMRLAEIYWHRIDWLESGDDGEDSFLDRLKKEIAEAGLTHVQIPGTQETRHED